jgi:folate-binding protein YgfZ
MNSSPIDVDVYELDAGVVSVTGPDAGSFLQSLLSQDLDPIGVGEGAPSLLLQPQGKLIATLHALRVTDDEWWCVTDEGAAGALATGLERFRIRVKAEVTDISGAVGALALRGTGAGEAARSISTTGVHKVSHRWGIDVVGARADLAVVHAMLVDSGARPGTREEYEVARIAAGVPRLGVDIDDRTIPQEAFLDVDAVSFTKGCFVGQELVCRIDTRGHVNRYLRRLAVEAGAVIPAGAEVVDGERVVGTVTSAAGSNALAMVRREVEPQAEVIVRSAGNEVRARVHAV